MSAINPPEDPRANTTASPLANPAPFNPDGRPYFQGFDPAAVPSPCYVIDRAAVQWNLAILRDVADRAGATMLVALKAFAPPPLFPLFRRYLDGACASGAYEARLAREAADVPQPTSPPAARPVPQHATGDAAPAAPQPAARSFQVHTFAPAYSSSELEKILELSDHVIFNSLDQWVHHRPQCLAAAGPITFGLRVNPECSLGEVPLYDPCAPGSRLGITEGELRRQISRHHPTSGDDPLRGITEIHFHTLCEDNSQALETTLAAVDARFGDILRRREITCLNMGGGHHITKPDYDRNHLVRLITDARQRYGVEVILEPGEAVAIHTGVLVTAVLDLARNNIDLAILDTSATAHMPDTLEMPYRAGVWGADEPLSPQDKHVYRLGGQTCLAGDVIGDYRFAHPLKTGDRLVFDDMSHYTMVKTTTFNGIPLPAIALWDSRTASLDVVRTPQYDDFRARLG